MGILTFSFSCVGPRKDNQDRLLEPTRTRTGAWLLGIADGVGGAPGGAEAAQLAVDTVTKMIDALPFSELFDAVAKEIAGRAEIDVNLRRMATTLSVILLDGSRAKVAHVGDTRIYLLRGRGLQTLTEDQTEVAELRRKKVLSEYQLKRYPRKNVLTSVLSARDQHDVQYAEAELRSNDRLLLLSDGTYGVVSKKVITDLSIAHPNLSDFGRALKEIVKNSTPTDNYSAILAELV